MKPDASPEQPSLSPGITRPLIAAMWVYAAGYLPMAAEYLGGHIPAWVVPVIGLSAGVIGSRLARQEWSPREYDRRLSRWASRLAIAAGLAVGGWLAYAAVAHPLTAAAWLALLTLPLGGWYWLLHRWAVRDTVHAAEEHLAAYGAVPAWRPRTEWEEVLASAGLPGVTAQAVETQAGVTLTVTPDPAKPAKFSDIADKAASIALRTAFARPDIELREDDVRIEPAATLPNVLIHISWKRPLRRSIPYEPAGPSDINRPQPLGIDEVGGALDVTLAGQNGQTVSVTGGGKSVVTNTMIGRIGECRNAILLVGATEKLLPLTYPWLRPWFEGKTDRPAIDGVAGQDPRDVLDMLADVYLIVKMRNARNTRRSKLTPSVDKPAVIVFLEEAPDIAKRTDRVTTFDGREWTASALLERICASDRSAGVAIYFVQQGALVDALGSRGSEIVRNVPLRICGRTLSSYDGSATLPALRGNVDTTRLRDNTLLIQPNIEEPRVYPWKSFYLEDDELIEPVAIRNAQWRPELEPEIAAQLQWYPQRWDHGRLPDLYRECEAEGFTWPGTYGVPERGDLDEADAGGGEVAAMTAARIERGVDETVATIEEITARMSRGLPEPLATLEQALRAENAPQDWVSTAQLAIVLDRVAPDASEEDLGKATWTLGRELSALVPNLKTTNPRNVGGGRKRNGYSVPRLRAACEALRRGEELAPEDGAAAAV